MVRWLGQRDDFRCGPIALVNIMKWAGIKKFRGRQINEKLAKGYLSIKCKTDRDGTRERHLKSILYKLPLIIEEYRKPSKLAIKGCLKSGGIILSSAPWWAREKRKNLWHFSLITEVCRNGQFYTAINTVNGLSEALITGDSLSRMTSDSSSIFYFIWKEE